MKVFCYDNACFKQYTFLIVKLINKNIAVSIKFETKVTVYSGLFV